MSYKNRRRFLQDPAMQRLYSQKIDAIDDNLDDELYLDDVLE